ATTTWLHPVNMQSAAMWSISQDELVLVPPNNFLGARDERMISVSDVDEFASELQKFLRERAQIAYLDFHTHGAPGGVFLGRETPDIDNLDKLRDKGFERLFTAGALINFLGCDVAQYDPSKDIGNDGELFLAEFAYIFLKRNGGRAVGSTQPWYYKPAFIG